MATSKEQRLVKQVGDALSDVRFSTIEFGKLVAIGDPFVQRRVVELMVHTMEMVAINYDNGNFDGEDYPYLRLAARVRNLMSEAQYNNDDRPNPSKLGYVNLLAHLKFEDEE
jgi:hypothetical protein